MERVKEVVAALGSRKPLSLRGPWGRGTEVGQCRAEWNSTCLGTQALPV